MSKLQRELSYKARIGAVIPKGKVNWKTVINLHIFKNCSIHILYLHDEWCRLRILSQNVSNLFKL